MFRATPTEQSCGYEPGQPARMLGVTCPPKTGKPSLSSPTLSSASVGLRHFNTAKPSRPAEIKSNSSHWRERGGCPWLACGRLRWHRHPWTAKRRVPPRRTQTRGGSLSRWKCRCAAIAFTNAASEAPTRSPGFASPFAKVRGIPAASSSAVFVPSTPMGLQCRYWSLHELERLPERGEPPSLPDRQGTTSASNSTEGIVSSDDLRRRAPSPSAVFTAPSRGRDVARHRAGLRQRRVEGAASPRRRRRRPPASRPAARAMLPSPGRASERERRRTLDLGLDRGRRRRGMRLAAPAMPSPLATRLGQLGVDVRQHRHHALADRRHLHLASARSGRRATMCAFSTRVWLFQNSVACV